jgi:hypothetical protein
MGVAEAVEPALLHQALGYVERPLSRAALVGPISASHQWFPP